MAAMVIAILLTAGCMLQLLPEPMFKIQKRIRLGPSTMGLRINYELPFIDAQNLWAPPARLMVRYTTALLIHGVPARLQTCHCCSPELHAQQRIIDNDLGSSGDRLSEVCCRVDNHMGGLKVSPGGADFDEQVLQLGDSTTVRGALSVDFPRALPLPQGERFFGWHARRLGIKTRW